MTVVRIPDPEQEYDHLGKPVDGPIRYVDREQNGKRQTTPRKNRRVEKAIWTEAELVDRINEWTELFGQPPGSNDWNTVKLAEARERLLSELDLLARKLKAYDEGDFPATTTVRERFGSWSAGLVAAGFAPRERGRNADQPDRLTDDQAKAISETLVSPRRRSRSDEKEVA